MRKNKKSNMNAIIIVNLLFEDSTESELEDLAILSADTFFNLFMDLDILYL